MFEPFSRVPAYPLVFPLFWGAVVVFGLAMARHLRVFAAARAAGPNPLAGLPLRIGGLVQFALVQTRMFADWRAGLMHAGIFWGFVALTVGTANVVTGGLVQAVLSWPFDGALWTLVTAVQNVVAVGVLIAIVWAFERRFISRPARLTYTTDALLILAMIGGLVAAELGAEIAEVALAGPKSGAIVSNAVAPLVAGVGSPVLETAFGVLWWAHIGLVSLFLVYLPRSKHLHIATSLPNIFFRKLQPRGELPALDLEATDATFGVATLSDLAWKDLLDGFTCTECGRCQEACPAHATGKPLNPKAFIMGIRDMSVDAEQGLPLVPPSPIDLGAPIGVGLSAEAVGKPIVDDAIPYDAVWDCVTCGACVEACPVLIEHVDKIVGLRRNLVLEQSRFPDEAAAAFRAMEGQSNPWGQPPSTRADWTKPLPFAIPTVAELAAEGRLEELEVLYWVGCAAAFDERNKKVARAVATCLDAAGVRFAILGAEEGCTGDPARRLGNDYLYQFLATANVETLNRYGMTERTIISACPHCTNSLGVEYRQLGGNFRVEHHSTFLSRLVAEGRLQLVPPEAGGSTGPAGTGTVTFHDPCYLARYAGNEESPREVLAATGLELVEMERHGKTTFCCGAGGGRMWLEETRGTRINARRTEHVLETGASTVAVACPFCMVMLRDGLADAGAGAGSQTEVVTRDISELLAERLTAAESTGRQLPVV